MRCAHCGRRIVRACGEIDAGPVGPVCARKLGLPIYVSDALRAYAALERQRPRRRRARPVTACDTQMALEFA